MWAADEKAGFDDWRSIGDVAADAGRRRHRLLARRRRHRDRLDRRQRVRRRRHLRRPRRLPHDRRRAHAGSARPASRTASSPSRSRSTRRTRSVVYAATGAGLFRSADAGATFANVEPADGQGRRAGQPNCTGAAPDKEGCALANMVTDVVVQGPRNDKTAGAAPGSVVAAVGWRAGTSRARRPRATRTASSRRPTTASTAPPTAPPARSRRSTRAAPACPSGPRTASRPGPHRPRRARRGDGRRSRITSYLYAIVEDARALPRRHRRDRHPRGGDRARCPATPCSTASTSRRTSARRGRGWPTPSSSRTRQRLRADRHGVRDALLPGRAGLVQPPDRAGPDAPDGGRRARRGWCSASRRSGRTKVDGPLNGPTQFDVVGPYFAGDTCLFLNTGLPDCPTTRAARAATRPRTRTSTRRSGSRRRRRRDARRSATTAASTRSTPRAARRCRADNWGRGANRGFNTLLPYDAQVAKDGTIYAGLQDNGELKIEGDGKQYEVYGGDGAFSAVDPDDSKIAYESYTNNAISKTTDGGKTWNDAAAARGHVPVHQPVHDGPGRREPPDHGGHEGVGDHQRRRRRGRRSTTSERAPSPATPRAAAGDKDPRQLDVGDRRARARPGAAVGRQERGLRLRRASAPPSGPRRRHATRPAPTSTSRSRSAPDEGNGKATIEVSWADGDQRLGSRRLPQGRAISSSRPAVRPEPAGHQGDGRAQPAASRATT